MVPIEDNELSLIHTKPSLSAHDVFTGHRKNITEWVALLALFGTLHQM